MDALNCFQAIVADLQNKLNADDISAYLYSAQLLTPTQFEEVNHNTSTNHVKLIKLLSAVEKAICIDRQNLSKFLDILDKIDLYRPIASQARGEWLSIVKLYVRFVQSKSIGI